MEVGPMHLRTLRISIAVAVAVVAWVAAAAHAAPPSLVGSYWCQVEGGGVVYAPQRCSIRRTPAGALLFEKSGGSQRFSGVVLPRPEGGFRFTGLFFCPQGACDEFFEAEFASTADGFRGPIPPDQVVTVTRARPTRPATP